MSRELIAYLIVALLVASAIAVTHYSRRFMHYRRSVLRGNRNAKPVWKPFWLP